MTRSIRLCVRGNGDRTLQGYVFTDRQHARAWLAQTWVTQKDYSLEAVEVGDVHRCNRCDGSGFSQTVKPLHRLTVEEFLREEIDDGR